MRTWLAALLLAFAALTCANVAHACNSAAIERVTLGERGEAVRNVQACLTAAGYATVEDGVYGPATQRAINAFYAREFPRVPHGTYLGPRGHERLATLTLFTRVVAAAQPTATQPAAQPGADATLTRGTTVVDHSAAFPRATAEPNAAIERPHMQAALAEPLVEHAVTVAPTEVLPDAHTPQEEPQEFATPHTQAPETPVVMPASQPQPSTPPLSVERTESVAAPDAEQPDTEKYVSGSTAWMAARLPITHPNEEEYRSNTTGLSRCVNDVLDSVVFVDGVPQPIVNVGWRVLSLAAHKACARFHARTPVPRHDA